MNNTSTAKKPIQIKSQSLIYFLNCIVIFFFLTATVEAETNTTENYHICYFSLNNEKEFTEMQKFTKKLNQFSAHFRISAYLISTDEHMPEGEEPEEFFQKMVESKEACDGFVLSGNHPGSFGGKRANGKLTIDFMEKLACEEKYSDWFNNVKALWLQGCRTLGIGEAVSEEEESADYHTTRVGAILEEDHLEQSFADLNMEFSATLDQDNPMFSRYLRLFPSANVFGWTKKAPGRKAGSEYSIPFHIAHIAKQLSQEDHFPTEGPLEKGVE